MSPTPRILPLLGLALVGCKRHELACEISTLDGVNTVGRITVQNSDERPTVTFGLTDALGSTAEVEAAGEGSWEALLFGLTALSDVHFAVSVGGEEVCAGVGRTLGLPTSLPDLTITVDEPALQDPGSPWFIGAVLGDLRPILVFDRLGRVLWYREIRAEAQAVELQILPEGAGFWHNEFASDRGDDDSLLRHVGWDGEEQELVDTPEGHHVFTRLDDGTLAWLALDVRDWTDPESGETEAVVGDQIVEQAPDGTVRAVWSTWDGFDVTKNERWLSEFYPQGRDWTHANALRYEEAADAWWISLGHEEAVVSVSRADGSVTGVYGNGEGLKVEAPVYPVAETSIGFTYQHDAHVLPDGHLLMFASHPEVVASGAIEYAVEGGELVQVWDHGLTERSGYSALLGQATRLGNGNTLINYGGTGLLREVTPSGEIAWEMQTGAGSFFGQVHPMTAFTAAE